VKNSYLILTLLLPLAVSCGGSSNNFTSLKKPVDIAFSEAVTIHEGRQTNLAYVADQFTQSVVVLDTVQEKIVDTADNDEFDFSPLPIGGEPTSVVVDTVVNPHRIYVADQSSKEIVAYEVMEDANSEIITYKPLDLGSVKVGKASRALFRNSGSTSSPTVTNIVVDPAVAKSESWWLEFNGDRRYKVTGSKSGLQENLAAEGTTYSTDDGGIEFFISAGGEKTTSGDEFFFGSLVTKPLQLVSSPIDLIIHERNLFILTKDSSSLTVFNLDTFVIDSTIGLVSIPNNMYLHDGSIYISYIDSGDISVVNADTLAVSTISTSFTSIAYVGADDDHLFLVEDGSSKLSAANFSGAIQETLNLNDTGTFFFKDLIDGKSIGFVPNIAGNVDVIDLATLKRIDTELNDKSDFVNPEFFDVGALSKPQLISVNGVPGLTMSETWQMIYDEDEGSYLLTGSKSGIQANRVVPGEAYTSDNGEISLRTRPSFAYPETTGDFFTFLTLDEIDPILISSQSVATGGISFKRISDGKPMGYIIQQTNGQVSIVDLVEYKVRKTL